MQFKLETNQLNCVLNNVCWLEELFTHVDSFVFIHLTSILLLCVSLHFHLHARESVCM